MCSSVQVAETVCKHYDTTIIANRSCLLYNLRACYYDQYHVQYCCNSWLFMRHLNYSITRSLCSLVVRTALDIIPSVLPPPVSHLTHRPVALPLRAGCGLVRIRPCSLTTRGMHAGRVLSWIDFNSWLTLCWQPCWSKGCRRDRCREWCLSFTTIHSPQTCRWDR